MLATGTYAIERTMEGTTDAYGDPVDAPDLVALGVRGSVRMRSLTQFDPASGRTTVTYTYTGRFAPGTALAAGDRVVDERTGTVYLVSSVHQGTATVAAPDVVADLVRQA